MEFCRNLYAFGGVSDGDAKSKSLAPYSFWAMEIVPDSMDDMFSETVSGCDVGIETFSVMSNAGRYWSKPSAGTITVTDKGVVFDKFDADFPYTVDKFPITFTPDERVVDTFAYINAKNSEKDDLTGLWRQKKADHPVFIDFSEDGNMSIYQKDAGIEVLFGKGGYEYKSSVLTSTLSLLGSGDMPIEFKATVTAGKDTLTLAADPIYDGTDTFFNGLTNVEFEKVNPNKVPIICLDDEQSSATSSADITATEPFIGVWIMSSQDHAAVEEAKKKLSAAGFNGTIIYAPEWSELTK